MTVALGTMRWGEGPRRILLLHGISSNAAGWWRVAPELATSGWQVTAADMRGHGTSPISDEYTLDAYASDVLGLGAGWDAVLGHSLGGAVAVIAQTMDPGWAGGLILQDPALLMPDAQIEEITAALLEPIDGPATEAEIAAENPRWHATDVHIKREALCQTSATVLRCTMEQNTPWNVLEPASSVSVPTVLLGSDPEEGGIVAVSIGGWLAEENPHLRYEMLEGAGHSAHREDDGYDAYLAAVHRALEWITTPQ